MLTRRGHLIKNTNLNATGNEKRETQLSKQGKAMQCNATSSSFDTQEARGREEERGNGDGDGDGEDRTVEEASRVDRPAPPGRICCARPPTPLVLFASSRRSPSTRRRCSSPLVVTIVAVGWDP